MAPERSSRHRALLDREQVAALSFITVEHRAGIVASITAVMILCW
ncbi:hypothetical protein ABZ368_20600 [Streptomyces sp. NPDC005908]|nr:hypothetical protein [Streptomyces sp. T12]